MGAGMRRLILIAAVVVVVAGCQPDAGAVRLVPLRGSENPLRERFNADRDRPRIVALLSPT